MSTNNKNNTNFVNDENSRKTPQAEGRKEGDNVRQDRELHGEHTAKAPELGSNSVADKLPKSSVKSSGGGM